jgi:predicted RNA-binding protein associated with RNAse of E/G family
MQFWKPGNTIALRGVLEESIVFAQACIVVRDSPEETVLLLLPGAECAFPKWARTRAGMDCPPEARWRATLEGDHDLLSARWQTNRFLMLLQPDTHCSVSLIWDDTTNHFECYYVNFQLPYVRTHSGLDTFDLELDLVILPDGEHRWKDKEDYEAGVRMGVIRQPWVDAINQATPGILESARTGRYPFDMTWRDWLPDPSWQPPDLPSGWDEI